MGGCGHAQTVPATRGTRSYCDFMPPNADASSQARLSPRWSHVVWTLSLATSAVAGAGLGGVLANSVAGAAVGALMAMPAGAVAALTLGLLGSVTVQAFTPGTAAWRRRRRTLRVVFGALAGGVIGVEIAVAAAVLGGATWDSMVWITVPALAVGAAGIWCPPHPQHLPAPA